MANGVPRCTPSPRFELHVVARNRYPYSIVGAVGDVGSARLPRRVPRRPGRGRGRRDGEAREKV